MCYLAIAEPMVMVDPFEDLTPREAKQLSPEDTAQFHRCTPDTAWVSVTLIVFLHCNKYY